jgi:hypothetical protein
MFDHLRGAGDWLRERSASFDQAAARAADAAGREPRRTFRSARAGVHNRHGRSRFDSAPSQVSGAHSRFHSKQPNPSLGFRLHGFLVGQHVIAAGVIDESVLDAEEGHEKYLVYLDLSVTNRDDRRGCQFSHEDLRLQGTKGLVYTPLRPRDGLRADLHAGETARGGVAFAIYNDSAPARLLYRTGPDSFAPLPEGFFSRSHH